MNARSCVIVPLVLHLYPDVHISEYPGYEHQSYHSGPGEPFGCTWKAHGGIPFRYAEHIPYKRASLDENKIKSKSSDL